MDIPTCVISNEYFMRTSLYLVRLKIFEWVKFHIKFRETEVVHMQECRDKSDMYNYQQIQISNNNSLMVLGGTLDLA